MKIERPRAHQDRPENAQLVFKGDIFDVYQWKQKLFDGGEATFEMLKRPDTVVTIPITADGRILILEEEQPGKLPVTTFPGGRINEGEDVVSAARRELLEETGYEASSIELWYANQPVTKIDWAIYVLFARGCAKTKAQSLDGGERIKVEEIDFEKFLELASTGAFDPEVTVKVLEAKLDARKMAELKSLFSA